MSMTAEATVIIPTHNRKTSLVQALASVRAAADNVDTVVVDDASSDTSIGEVCKNLQNVRYIRLHENAGPSAARNAGVAATNSKYLAFLDDDDLLLPSALDRLKAALDKDPAAALCYGQIYIGDQDCAPTTEKFPSRPFQGDIFWQLLESNFIMMHSALVRRECFEQIGAFDPELWHNEDWDLWVRLAERWPVVALDEPVGVVRLNSPEQLSQRRAAMYRSALKLRERWLDLPRARALPASEKRVLRRQWQERSADRLMDEAIKQLKCGQVCNFTENAIASLGIDFRAGTKRLVRGDRYKSLFRRARSDNASDSLHDK